MLGPLLFILCVNDMPDVVKSHIQMFADDTRVYREVNNTPAAQLLQDDIDALEDWTTAWQLQFNAEKCKVMHLGSKNSEYKYKMHKGDMEIELQPTTLENDLGVYIDPKLTFSSHCEQKVNKANKILGLIRRSYVHLDTVTVNASWCPIYRKDSELLENTQRRATKLAPLTKNLSLYTDRLITLGLPSLYYRRARGDVIEMYKHTHGKYTVVADYIKMDTDPRSRGHKYKLKKQRATKTIRQQYFSNRVTNTWNMLPADVVDAPSLNAFKARIDKHWRKCKYSLRSVHEAYNPTSSLLERPRPDTGS